MLRGDASWLHPSAFVAPSLRVRGNVPRRSWLRPSAFVATSFRPSAAPTLAAIPEAEHGSVIPATLRWVPCGNVGEGSMAHLLRGEANQGLPEGLVGR